MSTTHVDAQEETDHPNDQRRYLTPISILAPTFAPVEIMPWD
jgi:hypothetical protein